MDHHFRNGRTTASRIPSSSDLTRFSRPQMCTHIGECRAGSPSHRSRQGRGIEIEVRASLHRRYLRVANGHEVADTGLPCLSFARHFATCLASSADGPNTLQTEGRAVDGGLALPDACRGGRRPRGDARAERVSDHGGALDARPHDAVPAYPHPRRLRGAETSRPLAHVGAQSHSLRSAARLVLRADR